MATIHTALDAGITLLETADVYAPSWDSMGPTRCSSVRRCGRREAARRHAGGSSSRRRAASPAARRAWGRTRAVGAARGGRGQPQALGVEVIDLYQLHRLDPSIPMTAQVASLVAVRDSGLASRIGLSNVTLEELRSLWTWRAAPATAASCRCRRSGRPASGPCGRDRPIRRTGYRLLPWSPLGGADQAADVGSRYGAFAEIAAAGAVSPQRVVLAWLLARCPVMIPIGRRPDTVLDSVGSLHLHLTDRRDPAARCQRSRRESMYPEDQPRPPLR